MPGVDVGRDDAANAAAREVARPGYDRPSVWDRVTDWLAGRLARLEYGATHVPGGWITVIVTLILVAAAVVFAVRFARRAVRSPKEQELFGDSRRSAAEFRAEAERCAAEGSWSEAIRHRVRAVARQLEERELVPALPGRTAGEMAAEAGRVFPDLALDLRSAARLFDDVSYGERDGDATGYAAVSHLDDELGRREPEDADPEAVSAGWEPVG